MVYIIIYNEFKDGRLVAILVFGCCLFYELCLAVGRIYPHTKFQRNPSRRSKVIVRKLNLKMAAWWPYLFSAVAHRTRLSCWYDLLTY